MPLKRRVFGYHTSSTPTPAGYRYDLLSTMGYFVSEVIPESGACTTPTGWIDSPVVAAAHAAGVKVVLVAQLVKASNNTELLADPARRAKAVQALLEIVKAGGGDGVNVDFEGVPKEQSANFTAFMKEIAAAFQAIPGAEVSAALPAINRHDAYDLAAIAAVTDYVVLMGYDYGWQGSTSAGPVAPLGGGASNVTASVTAYGTAGVPKEKLILAVPYYGYDWATVDLTPHAKVKTGADGKVIPGVAHGYAHNAAGAAANGYHYDAIAQSPYYAYRTASGEDHVVWYDDPTSLSAKYALVNARDLAGTAIWTLNLGGTENALWAALATAFT